MDCFFIFKDKSKLKREAKSTQEMSRENKSGGLALHRAWKSWGSLPFPKTIPELYNEKEHNLRVFSFKELKDATNGFNRMLEIGEGCFGKVYKGTIRDVHEKRDPSVVAIKKFNQHVLSHEAWFAEVQFLGVVRHINLVKLLGYCLIDGDGPIQRLLVYEFMPNGSLGDHLFNPSLPVMPWETRLKIVLGAAQGLAYLHSGLRVQVMHRDFKSSNVLLDVDFTPKLIAFGLALEGPSGDETYVSTSVAGTYGYVDPEYLKTGRVNSHSDSWSFGVVLYEILTGRQAVDIDRPAAEQNLVDWVKQFQIDSKKFNMIMDPRLRGQYSLAAARMVAKLASKCLNKSPVDRPAMAEVVESLRQALQETEVRTTTENRSCQSPGYKLAERPVIVDIYSL